MNDFYNKIRNGMDTGKSRLIVITGKAGTGKSTAALSMANEVSNGTFPLDNIAITSFEEIEKLKCRVSPENVYILDDIGVEGFNAKCNVKEYINETLNSFDLPGVLLIMTVSEGSIIEKLVSPLADIKMCMGRPNFSSDTLTAFVEVGIAKIPGEKMNEYMIKREKVDKELVKKATRELIECVESSE